MTVNELLIKYDFLKLLIFRFSIKISSGEKLIMFWWHKLSTAMYGTRG